MTLKGKTAVVAGGARGIGRAYCERLAADGANIAVVDRRKPASASRATVPRSA
ncbi:SDR family NAD(P)-dependent oxidoreductase [Nocardia sp. CA-084685]|uniref:SDR family NAD(P)-dependent oxidoreductase n=1 Tax=Nocardia sp. CA-084685 TaxID=3239970 RepID=UPI003D989D37